MILEINRLIESETDEIREIGWLLYQEDLDQGLSSDVAYSLIEKLSRLPSHNSDIEIENAREEGYQEGYVVGYDDGKSQGKFEATSIRDPKVVKAVLSNLVAKK